MSWVDEDGIQHVSPSDEFSLVGSVHIALCVRCQETMPRVLRCLGMDKLVDRWAIENRLAPPPTGRAKHRKDGP